MSEGSLHTHIQLLLLVLMTGHVWIPADPFITATRTAQKTFQSCSKKIFFLFFEVLFIFKCQSWHFGFFFFFTRFWSLRGAFPQLHLRTGFSSSEIWWWTVSDQTLTKAVNPPTPPHPSSLSWSGASIPPASACRSRHQLDPSPILILSFLYHFRQANLPVCRLRYLDSVLWLCGASIDPCKEGVTHIEGLATHLLPKFWERGQPETFLGSPETWGATIAVVNSFQGSRKFPMEGSFII